jgi:hypothetical protein
MGGATRAVVSLAVMLMLTQACASPGAMSTASSTPSPAGTQSALSYGLYGTESYFKLEWQGDERKGKPMVSGYLTNNWGYAIKNVRLRVEALDAAGGPRRATSATSTDPWPRARTSTSRCRWARRRRSTA